MSNPFEIAAWRLRQISSFLDPTIGAARQRSLMRQRTVVVWPDGKKRRIPRSTLHRWIKLYQANGFDGLLPHVRKDLGQTHGPRDVIDYAIALLLEQPNRSFAQLDIYLRQHFADYRDSLSTLRRHVCAHPAYPAIARLRSGKDRRLRDRYEAAHPHECWQLDGKGPFPVRLSSGNPLTVHVLTVLDDHSRAVLAAHAATAEDTAAAINAFTKAAARYGLPERMQFDRGSAFDSHTFRDGIARCGVHRNYVRARHPEAQGKIEAYHRSLQRWFIDELQTQEVHGLGHLQDLLEATIALVYQKHRHRGIGTTPELRLGGKLSPRRITDADLTRAFYGSVMARSDKKTGEVQLPNGRFRVPLAFAGQRILFRYDPLREVAMLVTRDRREIALEPFVTKPLPPPGPLAPARGNGRLQRILDDWRGTSRANAEPAFGLPEVFASLAAVLGRPLPQSERDAREVQDFWSTHGPLQREPFTRACQRAKDSLGAARPLAVLLADLARQIRGDQDDDLDTQAVLA